MAHGRSLVRSRGKRRQHPSLSASPWHPPEGSSICEMVSSTPQSVPEAAQLEDTELNVLLSSRNLSSIRFFLLIIQNSRLVPAAKHSNHLEQVDHHEAKDWMYCHLHLLELALTCSHSLLLHTDFLIF